ncbi:MAG TPA: HEAT repeat domain-containing protein [Tepidisphaeraceae bacterium]|jgi:CheY-like chemotaxis protein
MKRLGGLALSLAIASFGTFTLSARAQDAASPAPAAVQSNSPLEQSADDFWHYSKVARYDLANQAANQVLKSANKPAAVLAAFEKISTDRNDDLDEWLLRWQQIPELKKSVTSIVQILNKGRYERRENVGAIQHNIERLNGNERAYSLAIQRLRDSGEMAVPIMIDYLRDPGKKQYYAGIQRAIRQLGREALNPLLAATEMKDPGTQIMVIDALGDIGYDVTVPYLLRLAHDSDASDAVRMAARQALTNMGAGNVLKNSPAQMFYDLGEKFYYNTAAISADMRLPVADVWYWDEAKGLTRIEVPPQIYNFIMAMRESEYALKLDPSMQQALNLWLAANYNREASLRPGQTDPTRAPQQPDANYYGVAAGAQYVNAVLARALHDHNSAVALRAVRSLSVILGSSNMFSGNSGQPIVDAMNYSDRQIRFEAAMAVAASLPQKPFEGQERVVPLLAEALAQSGKPNVLVILPSQNDINRIASQFNKQYSVVGATSVDAALNEAAGLSSVDVVILSEDLPAADIQKLFEVSRRTPQLTSAAKVIVTHSPASPYAELTLSDPMVSLTQVSQPSDFASAITAARQRAGATEMNASLAGNYAERSARLLGELAMSRGQILNLAPAESALLGQLAGPRADLVRSCGHVLALMNSATAQAGLLDRAVADNTPTDLKIALYDDLATSAKFWGNLLNADAVDSLQKVVASAPDLKVRTAAAQARGALNLPVDQARTLILQQSRT